MHGIFFNQGDYLLKYGCQVSVWCRLIIS